MLVKVTPKTYRTIFKLFKMMEEKGHEVPDFSLEMELEEAVKFFSKLLKEDLNNEVMFKLQQEKEKNNKEVSKKESKDIAFSKQKEKERHSVGRKSMTQNKIIEILKSEGTVTMIELVEKMQLSRSAVNSACMRLLEKGIIQRLKRGKYELVEKSNPEEQKQIEEHQENSEEKQSSTPLEKEELKNSLEASIKQKEKEEQKNFVFKQCKELFSNWKYYEVVEYIFTKTAFSVENLRKKLPTKSNDIVEVIQLALKEGCIRETEQDGRYKVEDIFRLYYFLLRIDRPVPFSKILAEFRGEPKKLQEINKTICYQAIQ